MRSSGPPSAPTWNGRQLRSVHALPPRRRFRLRCRCLGGVGTAPSSLFGRPLVIDFMTRIKMVSESHATGALADLYAPAKAQSPIGIVAPILQTMSLRPDFLAAIQAASQMHFTDGALSRAQHEMIASYVSAINRCRY